MTRSKAQEEQVVEDDSKPKDLELFNANDGVHGRTGGPYLDQVQARIAEDNRAFVEGREPNYDDLQPFVGIQLVNKENLIANYNNTLIAGDDGRKFEGDVSAPVVAVVPAEAFEVPKDEVVEEETSDDNGLPPVE